MLWTTWPLDSGLQPSKRIIPQRWGPAVFLFQQTAAFSWTLLQLAIPRFWCRMRGPDWSLSSIKLPQDAWGSSSDEQGGDDHRWNERWMEFQYSSSLLQRKGRQNLWYAQMVLKGWVRAQLHTYMDTWILPTIIHTKESKGQQWWHD